MAPRNRRRKDRRRPGVYLRYAFSTRVKGGYSHLTFSSIGISADFPVRVRRVVSSVVSNATAAIQIVVYGPSQEVVAESRPTSVGSSPRTVVVSVPVSTDFHLPSGVEKIFSIRMQQPETDSTSCVVTGTVFVEIKSTSAMVPVPLVHEEQFPCQTSSR